MALYHIALRTETHVRETLEVERDDLTALRIELARFVGVLLQDHANQIWDDQDWRVDVTDEVGLILYVMQISATDSAATMLYRPGKAEAAPTGSAALEQPLQVDLNAAALQVFVDRAVTFPLQLTPKLTDAGAFGRQLESTLNSPNLHQFLSPSS